METLVEKFVDELISDCVETISTRNKFSYEEFEIKDEVRRAQTKKQKHTKLVDYDDSEEEHSSGKDQEDRNNKHKYIDMDGHYTVDAYKQYYHKIKKLVEIAMKHEKAESVMTLLVFGLMVTLIVVLN